MTVTLTPDLEAKIREKVARGDYPNVSEVVREALRLLDEREDQLAVLRAKLQVGIDEADRGESNDWTPELMERLSREADELFRRGEHPDPDVCP